MWKVTGKEITIRNENYENVFYLLELNFRYRMQVSEVEYQKYKYGDEYPKEEAWTVVKE